MELYTLTSNFNRDTLVDEYSSVIWTERYNDSGDVTLVVEDTAANRALFGDVVFLGTPDSEEVMLLDTADISNGSIKVTGFTLDRFLQTRLIVFSGVASEQALTTSESWPGRAINLTVEAFVSPTGLIANWGSGFAPLGIDMTKQTFTHFVLGAESHLGDPKTFNLPRGPLFDWVKSVANEAKIGWKFIPINITETDHDLEFSTYHGTDRTSDQVLVPTVRFSAIQDTLGDSSELRSKRDYRTVAYAISSDFDPVDQITGGAAYTGVAYAYPGANTETDFNRRVLLVDITGITTDTVEDTQAKYQTLMDAHARNALANNNFTKVIDGEVVPQDDYTFGVDYFLGDKVELEDPHGSVQKAKITEYIRSSDSAGSKAYPTVSVEE